MRREFPKLVLAGILLASFTLAQVDTTTEALLERAKTAHGGKNLDRLATYRERAIFTYYDKNQRITAKLEITLFLDLKSSRARLDFHQGGRLVKVQIFTQLSSVVWTPAKGSYPMSTEESQAVHISFLTGSLGMRFGANREYAKVLGYVTWLTTSGTLVETRTQGVASRLLISKEGRLVGEQTLSPQGVITALNSDFRTTNGITTPFVSKAYLGSILVFEAKTLSVEINPSLPKETWTRVP